MPIHPQLLQDCFHLGRLPTCDVLLHRNALIPWFILVPETEQTDLLELPMDHRNAAMQEAALAGELMKKHFGVPKLNFAAIGNVVPQLHLHVVGRRPEDQCWPKPVWGNLTQQADYLDSEVREIISALQKAATESGLQFQSKGRS